MYPNRGMFDFSNWLRPSHATGWLSKGAFQFYGLCLWLLVIGYGLWRGVMFLLWRII